MKKKKAIKLVMEYERKQGRNPEKANKFKQGFDLKSGERLIDIKINGKKDSSLLLSFTKFKKLGRDISNYYVYLLNEEKEGEKPTLKILEPDFIINNLNLLTLINIKPHLINKLNKTDL